MYTYAPASLDVLLPGAAVRVTGATGAKYECVLVKTWGETMRVQRNIGSAVEHWTIPLEDVDDGKVEVCRYRVLNRACKRVLYNIPNESFEHKVFFLVGVETGRFRSMVVDGVVLVRGPRVSVAGESATFDWKMVGDGDSLVLGGDEIGTFHINTVREIGLKQREEALAERERIVEEREKDLSVKEERLRKVLKSTIRTLKRHKSSH